ncbi:Alpha/Beta hydrolase protein [Mrakia frigida]|uniref:alpha/beta fold hydrolase n=1 Tax=Mrakia frigida TaxID=29902 RepID=UPI003FCC1F1B
MPKVEINPSSGPLTVFYTISTPENANATEINPSLPTILFLHPVFCPSEIWEGQFQDSELRRCNLVAIDLRLHGQTEGGMPEGFTFIDGAEDVSCFMDAINLPPCFLVGVSMGSSISIHLAVFHPKHVLGLFLISPLSAWEPEEVGAGRQEIWEVWKEAKESDDPDLLNQAAMGALQLGFNNAQTELTERLARITLDYGAKQWGTPAQIQALRYVSVDLFLQRTPLPKDKLERIRGPAVMVHAAADVAYPEEYLREKQKDFLEAGREVDFISIEGAPHFANVTHAKEINPLLSQFVFSRTDLAPFKGPGEPNTVSPFHERLWAFDLGHGGDSDESEEEE